MKKISLFVSVLVIALSGAFMSSCDSNYKTVKRMQKMEEGVDNPTTKEELEEAIKKYDKRAIDLVTSQAQVGIWYKILGTRYLDEQMYYEAYAAFDKARLTYPSNANIYYWMGICAGFMSNSVLEYDIDGRRDESLSQKKLNYLRLSEQAYKRALELNPKYYRAMYGIGVLYVFQLEEYEKAIPYLENFVEVQKKNTDGMFILANAYACTGELDKAAALYDRIISINPNKEKTARAVAGKKKVLDTKASR
ncbi:MAG: tetratricopeptide repeat protein [Treponema sp.]|nr:tetratricopeptide repeat protein [Treponema sp.]